MDRSTYSAVLLDERVKNERVVYRDAHTALSGEASLVPDEDEQLQQSIHAFLGIFQQIYLCNTGPSLANKLAELSELAGNDCVPIFALFDVGPESESESTRRQGSLPTEGALNIPPPSSSFFRRSLAFSSLSDESYGLDLLSRVAADIQVQDAAKLIIPVAVLRPSGDAANPNDETSADAESRQITRCLDAGAVDALTTPVERSRVQSLRVHAYRVQRAALKDLSGFLANRKLRKQSWVGVHDQQPYAYLREAMVSKLMKGICNPEEDLEDFQLLRDVYIPDDRKLVVKAAVGNWDFSAHEFTDDELQYAACKMLDHALKIPELEQWRLSADDLRTFLSASRATYNSFVLYHNFRHAVDVLQSVFIFLLRIGALPPYNTDSPPIDRAPISLLLSPFDCMALLIAAIGHDVGHPGVNNIFLVKLNAPLAQLYNDNSVLEAFHCAAFSQILRRHWPAAFQNKTLRKLLISSILATDMGVHHKFMESLGNLQEKYVENGGTFGWKPQDLELYKVLICGLLIKCADISNVARPWKVAEQWTDILQKEFANQGEMEKEVGMETALFGGPPELGNLFKLATGQINFMGIFALPLFDGVSDLLPQMRFAVEQIKTNQSVWRDLIEKEKTHQSPQYLVPFEGIVSPRSGTPAAPTNQSSQSETKNADDATVSSPPVEQPDIDLDPGDPGPYDTSSDLQPVTSAVDQSRKPTDVPGNTFGSPSFLVAPDLAARRSSSALPLVTVMPKPIHPNGHRGSVHLDPETHLNGSSGDRKSLVDAGALSMSEAAVLLAGSGADEKYGYSGERQSGESQESGTIPEESSASSYRKSWSQNCHRQACFRKSAAAAAKRGSQTMSRGGRAPSTSTYSNTYSNTVTTPISPATQATSVLTADSGDDRDVDEGENRDDRCGCGAGYGEHAASSRPASSVAELSAALDFGPPFGQTGNGMAQYPLENGVKHHIMTTVNYDVPTDTSSRPASGDTGKNSVNGDHHYPPPMATTSAPSSPQQRPVPRRRSRLRLAFWRRKGQNQQSSQQSYTNGNH